jgi:ABC-type nitrate/sulfonate/bicarbonate transport system permease component
MSIPKEPLKWERGVAVVVIAAILVLWQVLAQCGAISPVFYPAPTKVAQALRKLALHNKLHLDVLMTLQRLAIGFVIGAVPGVLIGLAAGWSRRLRVVVDPIIAAVHPIPKIAIFPLIMVVLGIGEASKVAVVAVTAFFPMVINTMAGVRHISPIHFDVAKNYGARGRHVFTHVVFPGSLPMILTGVRLGLNFSLLVAIATEMVSATRGMGALIWRAWQTMRIEELYAGLFIAAVLGISFNVLVYWLTARLVPWQVERDI